MTFIQIPVTRIDGETWVLLKKVLGKKVIIRAASIEHKGRKTEPSGHRVDEAHAEGGVKCRSKYWDISNLSI